MPELYTQENHVMYLLSGGDIHVSSFVLKGPVSSIPLTREEAWEFRDQANDVSGMRYCIPSFQISLKLLCDPYKSYWVAQKSDLVVWSQRYDHADTAYVVLIRRIK